MTTQEILALPMEDNDANAETIGDYLAELFKTLWIEGEGFNGKRPFGNSGWDYQIYRTLAKANVIEGIFDDDGDLLSLDHQHADELIMKCIDEVFTPK